MPFGSENYTRYLKPPTKTKTSMTTMTNPNDRYGSVSPKIQPYVTPAKLPPQLAAPTTSGQQSSYMSNPSNAYTPGTAGAVGSGAGLGDPGTGWMSGIKPDAARMLFENPDAFLRQVAARMGLDPDAAIGALQMASPMARNMNELAMIMLGADPGYGEGSWDTTGNWMGNFLGNQMSPTGRYVDFNQGLQNLLGVTTAGSGQLSPLGSILGIDDPAGQSQAFNSLATALASSSLHPLWARAFQDELNRQGDAYISKNATTTSMDPYNQWLQSRGF